MLGHILAVRVYPPFAPSGPLSPSKINQRQKIPRIGFPRQQTSPDRIAIVERPFVPARNHCKRKQDHIRTIMPPLPSVEANRRQSPTSHPLTYFRCPPGRETAIPSELIYNLELCRRGRALRGLFLA